MASNYPCIQEHCDRTFSDFQQIKELARGSYGTTSLTKDKHGKLYCFKMMEIPVDGLHAEEKFLNQGLRSPFLVQVFHAFRVEKRLHIAMEYCPGGSLHDLMSETLTSDDILVILVQLVHGLYHLHGRNILHRDVKPGNIVLMSKTPPFRVKYCDYGESKHLDQTVAHTFRGTLKFMAPELVTKIDCCDPDLVPYTPAVDVWSLGIVLYLLVEKRYPFNGPWITNDDVIPRSNSEFGDLIEKMLVKDASRRITVEQLVNHPQIKEIYDFIGDFDESLALKLQVWQMRRENMVQSNLIANLQSEVFLLREKTCLQDSQHLSVNSIVQSQTKKLSNLQKSIEKNEQIVHTQDNSISALKSSLQGVVKNFDSKIANLNSAVSTQNTKTIAIESIMTNLSSEISSQISKCNALNSLFTDQSSLVSALDSRIERQEAISADLKDKYNAQQSKISSLQSNLDTLAMNLQEVHSSVTRNKSKFRAEFTSLKNSLESQQKGTTSEAVMSLVHALSNKVTSLGDSLIELQQSLASMNDAPQRVGVNPARNNDNILPPLTPPPIEDESGRNRLRRNKREKRRVSTSQHEVLVLNNLQEDQMMTSEGTGNRLDGLKFPFNFFSSHGGRVKFLSKYAGKSLKLSQNDRLVTHITQGPVISCFVPINCPPNGTFTLTLKSKCGNGSNICWIGFFDPHDIVQADSLRLFTGLLVGDLQASMQLLKPANDFLHASFSTSTPIRVTFSNNQVNFFIPPIDKTIECVDGWVFGLAVRCHGESWEIS
ncbi:hypothetical protein RCL1_008710 [Eukaryota sp. TZLM3-RCL]